MARRGDALYQRGGKGGTWWLDFRHNGVRHVFKIGKGISRSVAGELATVKRAGVLKGELGLGRKPQDIVFEEAAELFLAWAAGNKRPQTARNYRMCIQQLKTSFDGKRLSQIGSFAIEKHKFSRKGSPVRANRELQALKRLFYWSMGQKPPLYEGSNPLKKTKDTCGVTFFEESQGRLRYLDHEEDKKLLTAAKEPLRSMIVLAINTGPRLLSEALTLQWDDVDLRRNQISILGAYAKNKKPRVVPLNGPAREALATLKASAKGPYVFAKRDGSPYRSIRTAFDRACEDRTAFDRACEDAGLAGITPHVLRHTFATRLVEAGVDLRTVQDLGGWANLKMVERYSHVNERRKADAVKRLAEFHSAIHNTDAVPLAAVR
jgi:integrase